MQKTTTRNHVMFFFLCLLSSFQTIGAEEKQSVQLDSIIQYNNNYGENVRYLKTEFTRDQKQNVLLKMSFEWISADDGSTFWRYSQKEDMAYDDQNRLETRKKYSWNAYTGLWGSSDRNYEHIFYNEIDGRKDSVFYYLWDGYGWKDKYYKSVFTYDDAGIQNEILYKDLNGNGWGPAEKREYTYDGNGNLLTLVYYTLNIYNPEIGWEPSDKDEYTYDEHNNILTFSKYLFLLGGWVESDSYKLKHEYIYDKDNNIISDKTYRMEGGEWQSDTHYTYEYFYSTVVTNIKQLPYNESFDSEAALNDDYTVWKTSQTEEMVTWSWNSDSKDMKVTQTDSDDYLFTPALYIPVTHRCEVTFKARCENADASGKLRVMVCNAVDPAMVYTELMDMDITNIDYETYTGKFVVSLKANYYIGFCAYTADGTSVYLDDISVKLEKPIEVPAAIDYLAGAPAIGGVNVVTLQFYIPSANLGGFMFNGVDGYVIKRSDKSEPVCKVDNFQIRGQLITWKDENALQGENVYTVYTYNGFGESDGTTITVTTGTDYPGIVQNLKAEEPETGVCKLTWEAPIEGAGGGSFTPKGLSYNVYRYKGTADELIASGLDELIYVDRDVEINNSQVPVQYAVSAVNKAGEGRVTSTDVIMLGYAYQLPFHESFADCAFDNYLWTSIFVKGGGSWEFTQSGGNPDVNSQDNDGGMMVFNCMRYMPGNMTRLSSPKIDISGIDKPVLSFWMAHSTNTGNTVTGGDDALVVKVSADNGGFERLDSIFVKSDKDGWVEHTFALDAYKDCANLRLGFIGVVGRTNNIYLDNISVTDGSGLSILSTDENSLRIYGDKGFIVVEGVNDETVTVTTVDGKVLYRSDNLYNTIPVQKGLYLVSVGNLKVVKVIVR